MPYPTPDQFRELLKTAPPDTIVDDLLFHGTPYVFRHRPTGLTLLRESLSSSLNVQPDNVVVVGSAKLGFSLSPVTFPRRFSPTSDIDVVVVDEALFDLAWDAVLKWNYPRRNRLSNEEWRWARNRHDDLFWGWLLPHYIRFEGLTFPQALMPLRDLRARWLSAFRSLAGDPELARRQVSGRLYRTWNHARLYHVHSLRRLLDSLQLPEGG